MKKTKSNLTQRLGQLKKAKLNQKYYDLNKKATKNTQITDSDEDLQEYEIDKIIDIKLGKDNTILYKVIWKGYSEKEFTWEPFEHFNRSSVKKVYEFQQNQKDKFEKIKDNQKHSKGNESSSSLIHKSQDSLFSPDTNQHGSKQTEIGISTRKNDFKMSKSFSKKVKTGNVNYVLEYCPEEIGPKTFHEFKKLISEFEKKIEL